MTVQIRDVRSCTSYLRLKQDLNRMGSGARVNSFRNFLFRIATSWVPSSISRSSSESNLSAIGRDLGEDGHVLDAITRPGRNRFAFWKGSDGTRKRLRPDRQHTRTSVGSNAKGTCPVCFFMSNGRKRRMKTTCKCKECDEFLCSKVFGNKTTSCFDLFHRARVLEERERV